jgi:pyruvate kinase
MLSGETAAGDYPVEAVRTMAAIIADAEKNVNYAGRTQRRGETNYMSVSDAICHAACTTCAEVGAKAILTVSKTGKTARFLSKYRPVHRICACVTDEHVARHLSLSWGVYPVLIDVLPTMEELLATSEQLCRQAGYIKSGDLIISVAGLPISGPTNMITVHLVGESLARGIGIGNNKVEGKACVCQCEEDVIEKFRAGDVLVIPQTSNAILSHIKQAAAIVSEEEGSSSHAAIVGLTLGKPVVVGALGATKNLRDGMRVSVDATRGTVHLIE